MTLTLSGRLLCAAQQAYRIVDAGPTPDCLPRTDGLPAPSDLVGWLTPHPPAFVDGVGKINAALIGQTATEIIVAFRGTEPAGSPDPESVVYDWVNDLNLVLTNDPDYPGSVHPGFRDSLTSVWQQLGPAIQAAVQANPLKQLYFTGHSKGGAMANLAAWRCRALTPYVCTFAAARPGDQAFADAYNAAVTHSSRYEYADDIVPHVPPEDALIDLFKKVPLLQDVAARTVPGYVSVGALLYYQQHGAQSVGDSPLLQVQRMGSLLEKLLTFQFGRIVDDHNLSPGYGYANSICAGEWPLLPGQ